MATPPEFYPIANGDFRDFAKTAEAIKRGKKVKKESGVYFTSIEEFRRTLTPQRLGL